MSGLFTVIFLTNQSMRPSGSSNKPYNMHPDDLFVNMYRFDLSPFSTYRASLIISSI